MATKRIRALPPGRAGRIWIQRRLALARRGSDILDRKLRILRVEQQRYQLAVQRSAVAWTDAQRTAEAWLLRAALVGGERAIRLAGNGAAAQVEITWGTTMGVTHPAHVVCHVPERPITSPTPDSTALLRAIEAYETALRAAVEYAAASAALQAVNAEVTATRRRIRAIEDRWIPRLVDAQHAVQLALDEQEHDDGVRLRWAAGRTQGTARA